MNHNIYDPLTSGFSNLSADQITNLISSLKLKKDELEEKARKQAEEREALEQASRVLFKQLQDVLLKIQESEGIKEEAEKTLKVLYNSQKEIQNELEKIQRQLHKDDFEMEPVSVPKLQQTSIPSSTTEIHLPKRSVNSRKTNLETITRPAWDGTKVDGGASDLYAYLLDKDHRGTMEYNIIGQYGPPHAPTFEGRLVIEASYRNTKIELLMASQTSKAQLKNLMSGIALYHIKRHRLMERDVGTVHPQLAGPDIDFRDYKKQSNKRDIPENERFVSEEKQQRQQYRSKQKDEKNSRLKRDYRSKHAKISTSRYTGDFNADVEQFCEYLADKEYASTLVQNVPAYYIQKAFESWQRSGELVSLDNLFHIARKKKIFVVPEQHKGGYKSRVLLTKAFVASHQLPSMWTPLRVVLACKAKMPTNIGVTLRDIDSMERRKKKRQDNKYYKKEIDLSAFETQMFLRPGYERIDTEPQESFAGRTIRAVGRKLGEGMTEVVMPVVDKVKQSIMSVLDSMPNFKDMLFGLACASVLIFCAILTWKVVVLTSEILFGIRRVMKDFDDTDMSLYQPQVKTREVAEVDEFRDLTVKVVTKNWWTTLGDGFSNISRSFSDSEVVRFTKKLGDFSAAVKNIGLLAEKIREIAEWVMNATCKYFTGKAFFSNMQRLDSLRHKLNTLVSTVRLADISQMTDQEKSDFVDAYSDLVEMAPYIMSIDKVLGTTINSAMALAHPQFKACQFYVKSNITRVTPTWLYIYGPAGNGKTAMTDNFVKMIFDAMKVISIERWKRYWFGKAEPHEFKKTMIYSRQPEQEFWDNYQNQPVTKLDDFGQNPLPEIRSAEVFSLIRMVNPAPYPLHMASIAQKDCTNFKSKLVVTTTNLPEDLLTRSELQIIEAEAFKRRRTFAIAVSRENKHIPEGMGSREFIETVTLDVSTADKKTGKLTPYKTFSGYLQICDFMQEVAVQMLRDFEEFESDKILDHTSTMGNIVIEKKIRERFNIDGSEVSDAESDESSSSTIESETTANSVTQKMSTSTFEEIVTMAKEPEKDIDMSMFDTQMMGTLLSPFSWAAKKYLYLLHPEAKHALYCLSDENITTYKKAQEIVVKMRQVHKNKIDHWIHNPLWDHHYLLHGVTMSRRTIEEVAYTSEGKITTREDKITSSGGTEVPPLARLAFHLGMMKELRDHAVVLPSHINTLRNLGVDIQDVAPYIGLTNPIYWLPDNHKSAVLKALAEMAPGMQIVFFDEVKKSGVAITKSNGGILRDHFLCEYLYDLDNENSLRLQRGKSKTDHYIGIFLTVSLALAILTSFVMSVIWAFRAVDPTYKMDNSFLGEVQPQSSSPHLNMLQKDLARARKLPKSTNLTQMRPQFQDQTAVDLLPILQNNTYLVRAIKGTTESTCYALGVEADIFVLPGHMMKEKQDTFYVSALEGTTEHVFIGKTLTWSFVAPYQNGEGSFTDLALVRFPMMKNVRKITHLLFNRSLVLDEAQGLKRVDRTVEKDREVVNLVDASGPIKVCNSSSYVEGPVVGVAIIKMDEITREGMCGRPYIFFNTHILKKIGWIHIAGKGEYAVLGRINEEDVEEFKINTMRPAIGTFKAQVQRFELNPNPIILDDHKKIVGVTKTTRQVEFGLEKVGISSHKFVWPTKTQLIPTALAKESHIITPEGNWVLKPPPFPVTHEPACLRATGDIDPMKIGMQPFKKKKLIYGGYLCKSHYDGIFNEALSKSSGRILPLKEALKGIRNHPIAHSVKRSTSAGYYLQRFAKLKRHYLCFGKEELDLHPEKDKFIDVGDEVFLHRIIHALVTTWFAQVAKGQIPTNWVLACLKDELRLKHKVKSGSTRIFFMGNFAFMIISKMIFGEFVSELETNWMLTDLAVGCNPYSADWKIIHAMLQAKNDEIIDDDTEKWDINFPVVEFTETFPEVYCDYYNLHNKKVIIDLINQKIEFSYADLVYVATVSNFHCMIVISQDVYYAIFQSSGVDMTTIFNSIMNSAENRAIVQRLTSQQFNTVAKQWVYGDDLDLAIVKNVNITRKQIWDLALEWFNHKRTTPDKGDSSQMATLSTCKFLQRQFKDDGVMLCPLNIESINGMIQYIHVPVDKTPKEQFVINCKVALSEVSRHSEELYNKYLTEINMYLASWGSSWVIHTTYEQQRQDMLHRALHERGFLG